MTPQVCARCIFSSRGSWRLPWILNRECSLPPPLTHAKPEGQKGDKLSNPRPRGGGRGSGGEWGRGRGGVCSQGAGCQASTSSSSSSEHCGVLSWKPTGQKCTPLPGSPRTGAMLLEAKWGGATAGSQLFTWKIRKNNTRIKSVLCTRNCNPTSPHAVYHPHLTVRETEPLRGETAAQAFRVSGPGPPAPGVLLVPSTQVAVLGGSMTASLIPAQA